MVSNSLFSLMRRGFKTTNLGKTLKASLLILALLGAACNPVPAKTPPAEICWQCFVNGMAALTRDLPLPEHLLQADAVKRGDEFDANAYFDILDHLSMQPGYVLDYVYWYEELGGHPVVYARRADEAPFENYSSYVAARGEAPLAYLEHVQVDGSAEGFFQLIVLRLMGEQFYLWWHATMNDITMITDQTGLEAHRQAVEANCTEPFDPVLEGASKLMLEPQVKFEADPVEISLYAFSGYSGLLRKTFSIKRNFPHTVVSESTEKVLDYFCGVVP